MSGESARTIRNFSLELWQDLVLHGIRKSTSHDFRNFNVVEMVIKTFDFVPGLSRTPLLFIPRYLTNIFVRKHFPTKQTEIGNLEIRKSDYGSHICSSSPFQSFSVAPGEPG